MKIKEGNGFYAGNQKFTFVQVNAYEFKIFSDKAPTNRFSDVLYQGDQE